VPRYQLLELPDLSYAQIWLSFKAGFFIAFAEGRFNSR
jgi:hypothetical protein